MKSGNAHPFAYRPGEQEPVNPTGEPGVRKREEKWRENRQSRLNLTEASRTFQPMANPRKDAADIPKPGGAHPGIFNEQHPATGSNQRCCQLLRHLPMSCPVDRRYDDEVFIYHLSCPKQLLMLGQTDMQSR